MSPQDYLADGLTEDLITLVSRIEGFDVIARNSTFAYKGQHPDIRDVGETLGASYVVEGSLRQMGQQLRVTIQLIDAANGNHVWAEKYDRPLDEFFDLQDEVVAAIAAQLMPQLDTAAIARHMDHSDDTLKAWALTRRAYTILRSERNNKENLDRAISLSEQALAIDPNYADAYGTLARAHSIAVFFAETEEPERSKARAQEAIAKLRRPRAERGCYLSRDWSIRLGDRRVGKSRSSVRRSCQTQSERRAFARIARVSHGSSGADSGRVVEASTCVGSIAP